MKKVLVIITLFALASVPVGVPTASAESRLGENNTAALLAELDTAINGCAIPKRQALDTFLTRYATDVRMEQNFSISGKLKMWSFGIFGGLSLANSLHNIADIGQFFGGIMGAVGGISMGGGSGSLTGAGFDVHDEDSRLYILTLFDQASWNRLSAGVAAIKAHDSKIREVTQSAALQKVLEVGATASKVLPNNSGGREWFKKSIVELKGCLDRAEVAHGKLVAQLNDPRVVGLGNEFVRISKWYRGTAVSIFVLGVAPSVQVYAGMASGHLYDQPLSIWHPVKSYYRNLISYVQRVEVEIKDGPRTVATDFGVGWSLERVALNAQQNQFQLGEADTDTIDISPHFVTAATPGQPKRLSENWTSF